MTKKNLTTMWCLTLLVILLCANYWGSALAQGPASRNQQDRLTEEFVFEIRDFKFHHQGQDNNLNLTILLRYKPNISKAQYPDFRWIAKDIETLLRNYPNGDDYWEIVNKRLTLLVLEKYSQVTKIESRLEVFASASIPYFRSSRVTRFRTPSRKNPRSTRVN